MALLEWLAQQQAQQLGPAAMFMVMLYQAKNNRASKAHFLYVVDTLQHPSVKADIRFGPTLTMHRT
ncbi:MAG: type I toxin-antitoxin system ptaRNA1 family toxin [Azoarcus sp. PHD]|nr:MAG: type I toxin-antitoxin system ptaRNA1 family toxin [Azoarcus sp. PHD]